MDRLLSPVEQFHALPRQGNFEEKRVLILTEAARLFVEKGAHETSLSDIAALFGISKPALYHYAKSKDDIIAQILLAAREGNRDMLDHFQHSEGTGLEKLRGALAIYGESMNTDVGRCLALIQVSTFSEETLAVHRDTHRVLLGGLTEIIAEGVKDGSIKPCRPQIAVFTILHALNGMARWFREDGKLSQGQVTQQIIDHFFEGLADY